MTIGFILLAIHIIGALYTIGVSFRYCQYEITHDTFPRRMFLIVTIVLISLLFWPAVLGWVYK